MFPTSNMKETNLGYHVISIKEPLSVVAEQYRKLRTNIDYSTFGKKMQIINFTSANKGEGKTVTALNLAAVYSQSKKKTLLIDMDLRRPKIHRAFNLVNENGLTDVISAKKAISEAIQKVEEDFYVLPAGNKIPFSAEFLMSDQVREGIESLKGDYDKIIIDCPPISAVADAHIVSGFSDGTILVVASRKTKEEIVKNTLNALKENGANVLGGVLTRINKQDQRYGGSYYYYGDD
ncbi:MAG: CpsD/CapB family tyrosine-protein kinase [Candidatus Izemoplasmataceae bacterium]